MNAEHWICNLIFVALPLQSNKEQRNLNRKLFYGSSVPMVCFFPTVIYSCPLYKYFSNFYSARTIYPLQKPPRDYIVEPCHSGFHLQTCKIWFNWEQSCITLIFPLFAYLLNGSVCSVLGFPCLLPFGGLDIL